MRLLLVCPWVVIRAKPCLFVLLHWWGWALALGAFLYIGVLLVAFAVLRSSPGTPRVAVMHDVGDELEKKGLVQSTSYRIDRGFRIAGELGSGPHYYLHLADGDGTLHLCGSYLLDYEPSRDTPRQFPCGELTVRRHLQLGSTIDLICNGAPIEPELEARAYTKEDLQGRHFPNDGEIVREPVYDELIRRERERTAAA